MSGISILIVGLFLPLFPLSMIFNELFSRFTSAKLRIALLIVWPQVGIILAYLFEVNIPDWVITWALFTALLYAFRGLTLREIGLWTSFIATSSWAILWVVLDSDTTFSQLMFYTLGLSLPLCLLVLLCGELEKQFGAAYTGLYNGLAESLPRFSGVLVFVILAVVATPLFPGFTVMLTAIFSTSASSIITGVTISIVWLFWTWAGARLLQDLIVGTPKENGKVDLSLNTTWAYTAALGLLIVGGIYSIGGLS